MTALHNTILDITMSQTFLLSFDTKLSLCGPESREKGIKLWAANLITVTRNIMRNKNKSLHNLKVLTMSVWVGLKQCNVFEFILHFAK